MSRTYAPVWLRERIASQARHRCGYCLTLEALVGTPLLIDHIIPEALGGSTTEDNLWLACSQCNLHKAKRIIAPDPATGERVPLFDPRRQRWGAHFRWNQASDLIIARTPTGRATLQALRLNRPLLVRARRIWVQAGWHPPQD